MTVQGCKDLEGLFAELLHVFRDDAHREAFCLISVLRTATYILDEFSRFFNVKMRKHASQLPSCFYEEEDCPHACKDVLYHVGEFMKNLPRRGNYPGLTLYSLGANSFGREESYTDKFDFLHRIDVSIDKPGVSSHSAPASMPGASTKLTKPRNTKPKKTTAKQTAKEKAKKRAKKTTKTKTAKPSATKPKARRNKATAERVDPPSSPECDDDDDDSGPETYAGKLKCPECGYNMVGKTITIPSFMFAGDDESLDYTSPWNVKGESNDV
jgi:hypothetical protein